MNKEEIIKEKIIEILHEHTRRIMVEGKNKPLVRRGIKKITADQIFDLLKAQNQDLLKKWTEIMNGYTKRVKENKNLVSKQILWGVNKLLEEIDEDIKKLIK